MLYADDTQIYISTTPSKSKLHSKLQILQQCLDEIRTFLLTHQLQLNDSKTESMLIGTNEQLNEIDHCSIAINVGKSQINPVKSVKDLGVIFDENFSFNDQINQLSKKSHYRLLKVKT